MKKIILTSIASIALLLVLILPGSAKAHNGVDHSKGEMHHDGEMEHGVNDVHTEGHHSPAHEAYGFLVGGGILVSLGIIAQDIRSRRNVK